MNKDQYLDLNDKTVVISDSYSTEFTGLKGDESATWHKHYGSIFSGRVFNTIGYGNAITKGGWSRMVGSSPEIKKREAQEDGVLNNAGLSKSERKKELKRIWRLR
ncbi:MAG: hypothetical protein MUC52_01190 [Candidatus Omnitrophica bacterium]|jgi:hypothetical protein|nr:hypothetical protein [Candidatus Omnitrophota bacterium]